MQRHALLSEQRYKLDEFHDDLAPPADESDSDDDSASDSEGRPLKKRRNRRADLGPKAAAPCPLARPPPASRAPPPTLM